jgi:hypothetical protein
LPVFRDGINPLIATDDISTLPQYNNLCGFTDTEVKAITMAFLGSSYSEDQIAQELHTMKRWYNGYTFCAAADRPEKLYNPQLIFTHLRGVLAGRQTQPHEEVNAVHSASILQAIPTDGVFSALDLFPLLSGTLSFRLLTEFGAPEIKNIGHDASITWTLLYYFGVITHGENSCWRVPNVTMHHLVRVESLSPYSLFSNWFWFRLRAESGSI